MNKYPHIVTYPGFGLTWKLDDVSEGLRNINESNHED